MQFSYRWVIVAAGALLGCISAGSMFSLAVFLHPIAEATGWPHAGRSATMKINFLCMGAFMGAATSVSTLGMALGPPLGGYLYDRFGSHAWLYIGSFAIGWGAVFIALTFRPATRRLEPSLA